MNSRHPKVDVYPLSNYSVEIKGAKIQRRTCDAARFTHMEYKYLKYGMKTSVEGILLVHEHKHPHVLMLKKGNAFYKLPGGKLRPGEDEIEGLKRKLSRNLAFNQPPEFQPDWQIGQEVAMWWRPNFTKHMYPYCPPHIEKPKEERKMFIVHLSNRQDFVVPGNYDLVAVPFFDLYDNPQRYGPVYSSIPLQLSRFDFKAMSL
ncbi:pre-mRNA cleavage factor Im 25 kDa subunit 2-like [Silene latifolia]|uniref:pre-mRNA cleavage factor Im 25 kDa subunit 2-like n=1 Tax=Silene latifolia TaxID=37657 RepID=UPI003D77181B